MKDGSVKLTFDRKFPFDETVLQPGSICTVSQGDKFAIAICSVLETKGESLLLTFPTKKNVLDNHFTARCERSFQFLKPGRLYELDAYSSFSSFANAMGSLLLLMGNDEIR